MTTEKNHPHGSRRSKSPRQIRAAATLTALSAALLCLPAQADERAELEQLRATTTALIQALVDQGLLSRERADVLLRQAAARPATATENAAANAAAPSWGTPLVPGATAGGAPPVVRVPYLPESLRAQIKESVKLDVLATAREEGWADARQLPPWLRSVTFASDLRVRMQSDRFASTNLPAEVYRSQVESPAWSPDLTNTQTDRQRLTLRARFGANFKVSDDVSAGVRFSTGGTNGATSASQTLGTNFNRYAVGMDRAFLRWEPRQDIYMEAGRMAVPFYGTDMLWPDDLSVDGVALHAELNLFSGAFAFANVGAFPLEEFAVQRSDKWLIGAQVGADWAVSGKTQLRVGFAVYDFKNIAGVREPNPAPTGPRAGTVPYQLSQYSTNLRLRGNTLINLNDPTNTGAPVWGLASKFRPINLTAGITSKHFDPLPVSLVFDLVKNSAFDIEDIRRRAGTSNVDDLAKRTTGLQARFQVGTPQLTQRGSWTAFAAYRKFERDAWVDGLTDTTWNLGGTNYSGYSFGGSYAFDRNTSMGLRVTSTRNLDDGKRVLAVPTDPTSLSGNLSSAPLKIDVIQLEVSTRF